MTTSELWTVELDPATVGGKAGVTCVVKARDAREAFRAAAKQHGAGNHKPLCVGDLYSRGVPNRQDPPLADDTIPSSPAGEVELPVASIERAILRSIFGVIDVLLMTTIIAAVMSGVVFGIVLSGQDSGAGAVAVAGVAYVIAWCLVYLWLRPSRTR